MHQLRVCNNPLTSLPAGFAEMPGTIDITGTQDRVRTASPRHCAQKSAAKSTRTKESLVKRP